MPKSYWISYFNDFKDSVWERTVGTAICISLSLYEKYIINHVIIAFWNISIEQYASASNIRQFFGGRYSVAINATNILIIVSYHWDYTLISQQVTTYTLSIEHPVNFFFKMCRLHHQTNYHKSEYKVHVWARKHATGLSLNNNYSRFTNNIPLLICSVYSMYRQRHIALSNPAITHQILWHHKEIKSKFNF